MLESPAVSVSAFFTGLTLSASLIVAIGAQNTFVLRQGLRREHVAAVVTVCALLDAALMAVGVAGLGALVVGHPGAMLALAVGGAAALALYAASAFRRALRPQALTAGDTDNAAATSPPVRRVVLQALGISLLNPHVYLDTVVLVGAVGARQAAGTQGAFWLGAAGASALWFVLLGFGARVLAPWFARPGAWRVLDAVVGLTMAWMAVKLAAAAFAA